MDSIAWQQYDQVAEMCVYVTISYRKGELNSESQ